MSQDTPGTDAVGVGPLLDFRTQLPSQSSTSLTIYPDTGEAVIALCPQQGERSGSTAWSDLDDQERLAKNHKRATQRARKRSERYIVSNRLRYMWVLTFEGDGLHGAEGRKECMRLVADLAERFKARYGHLPYWFSPELHPGGHGWHVNFFIGKRVKHAEFEALWGHGFVWVKDWTIDDRVKALKLSFLESLRLGASYGSKYASKDWAADVLDGGSHRYECAQGFQPKVVKYRVASFAKARSIAERTFGSTAADSVWRSADAEDWDGPPVEVHQWRIRATPFGTKK